jgi:hypothetical protein
MKNITKFDKFMFGGLAFLIILGAVLTIKSCNAQTINTSNLIELNPYENDVEEPLDYDGGILFFADGVIDFVYHTQDNEYIIEYDDPDAFDPDNMLYHNDGGYYYIEIHCDSVLFFEYLNYYNSLGGRRNPEFFDASEEYFIEEDYLKDGTPYYKLVKYATEKNL